MFFHPNEVGTTSTIIHMLHLACLGWFQKKNFDFAFFTPRERALLSKSGRDVGFHPNEVGTTSNIIHMLPLTCLGCFQYNNFGSAISTPKDGPHFLNRAVASFLTHTRSGWPQIYSYASSNMFGMISRGKYGFLDVSRKNARKRSFDWRISSVWRRPYPNDIRWTWKTFLVFL